ncbi:MAG: dTDP-4-dehydrorhamnose 3,5-epimerase [Draconibacterium sp.]
MDKIAGITLTPLKRIEHEKGDILHGMKRSEATFSGFGEAYFSTVIKNEIKAWKCHRKMVLNLIVPAGAVKFVVKDLNTQNPDTTFETILSKENYCRLTIQPGLWFGFMGIGEELNLVCNIASIEHNPNEVGRKELHEIAHEW